MRYIMIPEESVDVNTRIAAHRALASARKELKLPMVNIKWFVNGRYASEYEQKDCSYFEHDDPCIQGLFYGAEPNTIYIQAYQTDDNLKNSVYHEVFHAWQLRNSHNPTEENAYGYADDLAKRLSAFGEDDSVYLDHMMGKDWSVATANKGHSKKPENKRPPAPVAKSTNLRGGTIKKQARGYIIMRGE